MPENNTPTKKLVGIRTFRSDIELARSGKTSPVSNEENIVTTTPKISHLSRQETIFIAPEKESNLEIASEIGSASLPSIVTKKNEPANDIGTQKIVTDLPAIDTDTPVQPLAKALEEGSLTDITNNRALSVIDTTNEITEGTIVTDKKRGRFELFPSAWQAAREWIMEEKQEIKDKADKKAANIPKITEISKRKDIIEKAAQQSALAPKDDHLEFTKKVPEVDKKDSKTIAKSLVIKDRSAVKASGWKHFTGQIEEVKSEEKEEVKSEEKEEVKETVEKISDQTESIPSLIPPAATTSAEPEKETAPIVTETLSNKAKSPVRNILKAPTAKKKNGIGIMQIFGRLFLYATILIVAIVAAGSGIGAVWWLWNQGQVNQPIVAKPIETAPALVQANQQTYLELSRNKEEFWEGILSRRAAGTFTLVISTVNDQPAQTIDITETIGLTADNSFARNIKDINIGLYDQTPFIVMRVAVFDTAFGGILSAENNLYSDLSPAFGTSTRILMPFEDDTARNHDVRVQSDETGQEVITYGFINRNTLLITRDRDTFATVADAVR